MAYYHCAITIISRGAGQSACAAAAYQSGERIVDERTGEICEYSRAERVNHTELVLPDGAPDRWMDRSVLWNEVEATEKRKDSRLGRKINVALPREFTRDENISLVREYVKNNFVCLGMVADFSIHADENNPHAHIMLTDRTIDFDAQGFGKKDSAWNKVDLFNSWTEGWAKEMNISLERYYEREQIPEAEREYVSHLSYKARGLDRVPQVHEGPAIHNIEKREQNACEREGREYEPVTPIGQYNERAATYNALQRVTERLRELGERVMEQVRSARDFVIDHFTRADELREQQQDIKLENKELRTELKEREFEVIEKKEGLKNEREPYVEQIQERDNAVKRKEEEIERAENRLKELKDDWRPHPVEIPKLEMLVPDLKEEGQNLRIERDQYAAAVDRHFESQTREMEGLTNRVENITVTQEQNIDQINELNRAYNLEVRDGKKAYKELDREEQQDVKRELEDSPSFQKEIASKEVEVEQEREQPEIEREVEVSEPELEKDMEIEYEPSVGGGNYDYEDDWELER